MAIGIIQARMGSTRLPGKMMLPLNCTPTIVHMIRRALASEALDSLVVATSDKESDDIIEQTIESIEEPVKIFRGSEQDVLDRTLSASSKYGADEIVRICGDRPLIPPDLISYSVNLLSDSNLDYVGNMDSSGFPAGFGIESFTRESLEKVDNKSNKREEREHVTLYYRNNYTQFSVYKITPSEVFESGILADIAELRLTLDNAQDYRLISEVYDNTDPVDGVIPTVDAVNYILNNNLKYINKDV